MPIIDRKYGLYLLSCVCGWVDATCFVGLHRVFAAMMSGNLLMFAIALANGEPIAQGFKYIRALGGFTVGIILASRLMRVFGEGKKSLKAFWLVWFLLALAVALSLWREPESHALLKDMLVNLLSMAMGAMASIVRIHEVPDLATNVFTGTYTSLIAESSLAGAKSDRWLSRIMSIFLFIVTGAIGGYLANIHSVWSLGLALLMMSIAMLVFYSSAQERMPA
ncbi:YoaK family protein [Polynucleobacter necessarius]|uniref:YoaK family protein n=1 Tax=Polynucleobacter necessarius TaxID=576610 RepID=UPI000E095F5E|nr:YoaK family protein [Polynucleobacter necessarius]